MDKNLQTDIDTLREAVKKLHYLSLGNVGTTKVNLAKIGHGALETLDRIVARIPEPVKICKTCAHVEGDFSCCSCKAPEGNIHWEPKPYPDFDAIALEIEEQAYQSGTFFPALCAQILRKHFCIYTYAKDAEEV